MQLVSMDVNSASGHSQSAAAGGSQIRSRVTVVCAECKRLKLKCDRRTPCSSCLKRDTVPRCTYSAAAAEKIDVQSLHNRVLVLESQVTQLSAGGIKMAAHDTDHALLAVGASSSSVIVPLDDVAGIWFEHLDLGRDSGIELQPAFPGSFSDHEISHRDLLRSGSSPWSHDSAHSSPHLASASASGSSLSPFSQLSAPVVTPALLALLPSAQQRPALLDVLGSVLRMHPSLNFPHFRARITSMFANGSCPEEIGIGPPRTDHAEKRTLSFFAAAAAGFALAMQCSPAFQQRTASPPSPPTPAAAPTVSSLLTLSAQALERAEDTAPYDLDFLHALILRCLCMLHDGLPRVSQAVFATVGRIVNVARLMGLAHDPDEFAGSGSSGPKYSLWEAEMRRRMWWDVFYYDLFISDCMGFTPLISDDQHTCRMPTDVDEDAFVPNSITLPQPVDHPSANNFSYFVQKCKLAQLVKNMKKRSYTDASASPLTSTPAPAEPSLDAASQAASEIHQYLADLPPTFKLDIDTGASVDPYSMPSPMSAADTFSPSTSPSLVLQRCELVTLANQMVLKLYLPFLRRTNVRPPDNALMACMDAAHAIINASRIARCVYAGTGTNIPSSHGIFYPFTRQLFDATIIAAHVIILAPQTLYAKVALEDVRVALDVLRDPALATGRGRGPSRGGVEGCPSEVVSIVEMMLRKAEMTKRNHAPAVAGTKRKHEDVEASVPKGFWLPYVGTGVATESGLSKSAGGVTGLTNGSAHGHGSPRAKISEKPFAPENQPHHRTARERDKERKYPAVGIRNRISNMVVDQKSPVARSSSPRAQPEQPASSQQPQQDPGGYARPSTSSSGRAPSIQPEPVRGSTGEFALSAPYAHALENASIANMNVSPTTASPTASRFTPLPQSHSHTYSTHSFQASGGGGAASEPRHHQHQHQHQPMYESRPYASDSTRHQQHQSPPFYVPYPQPPSHPPHQTYQPMNSQHPHPRSHVQPQHQQQHPHIGMSPLVGLVPNQDATDVSMVTKQEEGTDTRSSHPAESPFAPSDAWGNAEVATRFAPQAAWDSGYNF